MKNKLKSLFVFIGFYTIFALFASVSSSSYGSTNHASSDDGNSTEGISSPVKSYFTEVLDKFEDIGSVDTANIIIDNIYTRVILDKFIEDAVKHGLDSSNVINHIRSLDGIIIDDLSKHGLLGVTIYRQEPSSPTGMRGIIVINKELLGNPSLYMFTLYHELGHWFGLPHCVCGSGIMIGRYNEEAITDVLLEWDKEVKKLMEGINEGYNSGGSNSYIFPGSVTGSTKVVRGVEFSIQHTDESTKNAFCEYKK